MTPARLARVICRRKAGIVDVFEIVKVILWDRFLWRVGGGRNFGLGDNYGYYVTLNVYKYLNFCNHPKLVMIGPIR